MYNFFIFGSITILGYLLLKSINSDNKNELFIISDKYLMVINTANSLIKNNLIDYIMDVRSEDEFNTNHYKNAINIPLDKINNFNKKLKKIKQ